MRCEISHFDKQIQSHHTLRGLSVLNLCDHIVWCMENDGIQEIDYIEDSDVFKDINRFLEGRKRLKYFSGFISQDKLKRLQSYFSNLALELTLKVYGTHIALQQIVISNASICSFSSEDIKKLVPPSLPGKRYLILRIPKVPYSLTSSFSYTLQSMLWTRMRSLAGSKLVRGFKVCSR